MARQYVAQRGTTLICQNYTCRRGEVDLVFLDGGILVFAEVRYRRRAGCGGAAASISQAKRHRIIATARHFLMVRPDLAHLDARFDVIAIDGRPDGAAQIDWIRDAFRT